MAEKPKRPHKFTKGHHLSAGARQALPKSDFARPGKGDGPKGAGSGSYPIPDESHARNALARSSGKPEAAEVRRKVHEKFPNIGKSRAERRYRGTKIAHGEAHG